MRKIMTIHDHFDGLLRFIFYDQALLPEERAKLLDALDLLIQLYRVIEEAHK